MQSQGPSTVDGHTQAWLEGTLRTGVSANTGDGAVYDPSGRPLRMSAYDFGRLHRKTKILRWLDAMRFTTLLDVASGFEHMPWLAAERYGAEGFYSDLLRELTLPSDHPGYGKLDHAVTLKLPVLPFGDQEFDVVLCSEVLEHLERPVESVAELLRVTRKHLVLTSLEALSPTPWQRWLSHHRVDLRVPHVERNFFLLREIEAIFGPGLQHEPLFYEGALPASSWAPTTVQDAAYARLVDPDALVEAVCRSASVSRHGVGTTGILLILTKPGIEPPVRPEGTDPELVRWLLRQSGCEEERATTILAVQAVFQRDPSLRPKEPSPDRPVQPALLARLRCPDCAGTLENDGKGVACRDCGQHYSGDWGTPFLHYKGPRLADPPIDATLHRLCGDDVGRRAVVARMIHRLRRNERPAGPLRRALWRIDHALGVRSAGERR